MNKRKEQKITLTRKDGKLKVLSSCPECGGQLTARELPDYLSASCQTASSKHIGAGLIWQRTLRRYNDTGVPYHII